MSNNDGLLDWAVKQSFAVFAFTVVFVVLPVVGFAFVLVAFVIFALFSVLGWIGIVILWALIAACIYGAYSVDQKNKAAP